MKIIVQNPEIFLPPVLIGQYALCQCAAGARVSRGKRERYKIGVPPMLEQYMLAVGHNDITADQKSYQDAEQFISKRILGPQKHKHESVLEHGYFSVDFVMSRIASHEIVRHRHCGITQESTRYVPLYNEEEVYFIKPPHYPESDCGEYETHGFYSEIPRWARHSYSAFTNYKTEIQYGVKRESARYQLPPTIACEMRITASLREWRHIVSLRTSKAAAPELQSIIGKVKEYLGQISPVLVEDL
jgi:thymidylate synthase (FAD)